LGSYLENQLNGAPLWDSLAAKLIFQIRPQLTDLKWRFDARITSG
jgi:hypothetical protein